MAKRASEMKMSEAVMEELRSLSPADADRVIGFLQRLTENPYDASLIDSAEARGELFASKVTEKLIVYWSLDSGKTLPHLSAQPEISVLGLARKRGSHGPVRLLSGVGQKLQSA